MDKDTRIALRNTVTQCRRLLENAVGEVLEGHFGVHPSGKIEEASHMGHLSAEDREYREQILIHLNYIRANGHKPNDSVIQLVREVAFTHLNRFIAYKMMERRGLIREAVSRGAKSQGFLFYLADHPDEERLWTGGQQDLAYRHYLLWLGERFSEDISALFSPNDPANRLFPPQRTIDQVLALVNNPELAEIWDEDETIGWVYQYFTPDELRRQARNESRAPRNSYELAFLNQFYTPRYVVEFLVDNTLGRIWYEMRQGDTALDKQCGYLVRQLNESFQVKGEGPSTPANNDEASSMDAIHNIYRRKRDPRSLKILDPAGGSGHFLLYCFDLLEIIYHEAYEDPELGPRLRADYPTLAALNQAVPGLILRHNLHLIDIDRRATQIAALALWLRAQRTFQSLELKAEQRPPIRKANIVCAEPMPGDMKLLEEFVANLQPPLVGQLVRRIFEKMKLAGEAGSLLKIDQEIQEAIGEAKQLWLAEPKPQQLSLFSVQQRLEQIPLFDVSGISDAEFWERVEEKLLGALADYAVQTSNGRQLARRLFVGDAIQGLAFIEVCHRRFDVILMNPPFGASAKGSDKYIRSHYQDTWKDIYAAFFERCDELLNPLGKIGAITSSLFLYTKQLREFRTWLLDRQLLTIFAELGLGVLDGATVSTALTVLSNLGKPRPEGHRALFVDLTRINETERGDFLIDQVSHFPQSSHFKAIHPTHFKFIEGTPFCYHLSEPFLRLWKGKSRLEPNIGKVVTGNTVFNNERFIRLRYEVDISTVGTKWIGYEKGGEYQPFYSPTSLVLNWENNGEEVRENERAKYKTDARSIQSISSWYKKGITYPRVSSVAFGPRILAEGEIFSEKAISIFCKDEADYLPLLAILNSSYCEELLTAFGRYRSTEKRAVAGLPLSESHLSKSRGVLTDLATEIINALIALERSREPSPLYMCPTGSLRLIDNIFDRLSHDHELITNVRKTLDQIDCEVANILFSSTDQSPSFESPTSSSLVDRYWRETSSEDAKVIAAKDWVSYGIGCVVGRWDIRFVTGEKRFPRAIDPFAQLPVCSPGMLIGHDGLLADASPPSYPFNIDWDGVMVDDPDHSDDIIRQLRSVFDLIWENIPCGVEQEICDILSVNNLRDYFRKPAKSGFWAAHIKRYSKSRRKAPIYWLLQSNRRNYALWLYYHRLDKDTLFKALVNYVEPKLQLEETRLENLTFHRATLGTGGREAKLSEREIDRQDSFLSELRDFHEKLRRVADLHLEPDLNDGVILNIAPLHELVPWKDARKKWEELLEGKCEWSSIGQQLRTRGMVKG